METFVPQFFYHSYRCFRFQSQRWLFPLGHSTDRAESSNCRDHRTTCSSRGLSSCKCHPCCFWSGTTTTSWPTLLHRPWFSSLCCQILHSVLFHCIENVVLGRKTKLQPPPGRKICHLLLNVENVNVISNKIISTTWSDSLFEPLITLSFFL